MQGVHANTKGTNFCYDIKLSAVNEIFASSIPQLKQPKETVKINPQHPLATRHFDYPKPNKSNETLQIK